LLQPYLAQEENRDWYKGTANAVYQNLEYIEGQKNELVLILMGDHIYNMDYLDMVKFHEGMQADVSLVVTRIPEGELQHFGTVTADEIGQITDFQEKVKQPKSDLASMGVYLFKREILKKWLEEDAQRRTSKHDFGRDILPRMVGNCKLFAYSFEGYWRDVGTVESYWQANMEMLEMSTDFLSNSGWPIRTREEEEPPTIIYQTGDVANSLISSGCVIGGRVEHSILSPGVKVAEGAVIKDSIIMTDTIIGRRSIIDHSILDKEVIAETGCHIGFGDDFHINHKEPKVLNTGITIVGKGTRVPPGVEIGRNCAIFSNVTKNDFPNSEIKSGETVRPKRRRRGQRD
jgi:glucose-1-phosphate adenylyltransferase